MSKPEFLPKVQKHLFVLCVEHSWNLLLGEMGLSAPIGMLFFGTVPEMKCRVSGSAQRWTTMMEHDI